MKKSVLEEHAHFAVQQAGNGHVLNSLAADAAFADNKLNLR
ncbi:hypothetical protein [Paenibacillus lycopersici]|nr:hypothetical protein [Paenibacillus lycopersici]